jgi:adenosine deaminase
MKNISYSFLFSLLFINLAIANTSRAEEGTNAYLFSISANHNKIKEFFQSLPKGGDLHTHLGGASLAESLLKYGLSDSICIDEHENIIKKIPGCMELNNILHDRYKLNKLIDAWSMRNFDYRNTLGHNHFFSAFDRFSQIADFHNDLILTEVTKKAFSQHEKYLEIMITPDHGSISKWGKEIPWTLDFSSSRIALLKTGLLNDILKDSETIVTNEIHLKKDLSCINHPSYNICKLKINFIYQIFREQPPAEVFTQMLAGFELATINPSVVAVNLVEPEDGVISLRDYKLQMEMLSFFHAIYPSVHITLHAGELSPDLTFDELKKNHIRDAVNIGHAERIGHGLAIKDEKQYKQLLNQMGNEHVAVEINLSSNAATLGVLPKDNPLSIYLRYKVPIVLSTDDEGVLRTSLSNEYMLAFKSFKLSYPELKKIDRNSLTYSFLSGKGLWIIPYSLIVPQCKYDSIGKKNISSQCRNFLDKNFKAQMQWQLESDFNEFEKEHRIY